MSKFQLTFALIKPHAVKNPFTLFSINQRIGDHFNVVKRKQIQFTNEMADQFYAEHQHKFFFNRLKSSMCSGTVEALILCSEDAITKWRNLIGPTKVFKSIYSHPTTIRGQFGLSDTRNICHGADSDESVKREIDVFFPEFSVDNWYISHESYSKESENLLKSC